MIPSFIILVLSYFSIIGFSILIKKFIFINKNNNINFYNFDFFYGITFIILFASIINFFFPLKKFSIFFIILGLFFFLLYCRKVNFRFNITIILILIFFLLTLIILKNYHNIFYLKNYYTIHKDYDYSGFELLNENNSDVYYNRKNNFCYDFKKICVLNKTKNYFFTKKNDYFFFTSY